MKKITTFITTLFLAFSSLFACAQTSLSGEITDDKGETLFAANIVLYQNGNIITGAEADFDGNYNLTGLEAGIYDIRCTYSGMADYIVKSFVVKAEKANVLDFTMTYTDTKEIFRLHYLVRNNNPIFTLDMPTSGATYNSIEVQYAPVK